mmetsp:Transcript_89499/g.208435  ORF Transcript_89499/g.208435 Transcript_89499/m.208435 type:complete len:213 (+) Transcript_89499:304-942(+)
MQGRRRRLEEGSGGPPRTADAGPGDGSTPCGQGAGGGQGGGQGAAHCARGCAAAPGPAALGQGDQAQAGGGRRLGVHHLRGPRGSVGGRVPALGELRGLAARLCASGHRSERSFTTAHAWPLCPQQPQPRPRRWRGACGALPGSRSTCCCAKAANVCSVGRPWLPLHSRLAGGVRQSSLAQQQRAPGLCRGAPCVTGGLGLGYGVYARCLER